jgi:hypothetical protein
MLPPIRPTLTLDGPEDQTLTDIPLNAAPQPNRREKAAGCLKGAVRLQADNRLEAAPRYKSGPSDTIQRIARVVVGNEAAAVH